MVGDINYWLNHALALRREPPPTVVVATQPVSALPSAAINSAVEASLLSNRVGCCGGLLAADVFIRDNITEDDYLLVSVGGNDVVILTWACFLATSRVSLLHAARHTPCVMHFLVLIGAMQSDIFRILPDERLQALCPSCCTVCNMVALAHCRYGATHCPPLGHLNVGS